MSQTSPEKLLAQAVDAYEFRGAELADIQHLVDLYHEYFDSSYLPGQGLVYDPKRAWATLFRQIGNGTSPHIIAIEKTERKLVGLISYNMNHDYTEKPFASLDKLYVRPRWRRSPVGRILMTLCLEVARADGAEAFYASLNSGMTETASCRNMLTKMGFEPLDGVIMTRRF